jgi:RNA 2',3'-cyclic 3'-phosphodiesterase
MQARVQPRHLRYRGFESLMKLNQPHGNSSSDTCRLFVALPLAGSVAAPLRQVQTRLGGEPGGHAVRWTHAAQLHLTLAFLGDVHLDRVPELCRLLETACDGTESFLLRLQGLGCFPLRGPVRVVWVGIQGALESLGALQISVGQKLSSLGSHQQTKPFLPHLTIGRIRAGEHHSGALRASLAALSAVEVGDWPISEVVLMRSELHPEGARYTRLLTVALLGGTERI